MEKIYSMEQRMLTYGGETKAVNVIIVVEVEPGLMAEIEKLALENQQVFAAQGGFVSAALLKSRKEDKLVQLLQWQSEQDHLNCMSSLDWLSSDSSRRFLELVASGKVSVDPQIYDLLAVR